MDEESKVTAGRNHRNPKSNLTADTEALAAKRSKKKNRCGKASEPGKESAEPALTPAIDSMIEDELEAAEL